MAGAVSLRCPRGAPRKHPPPGSGCPAGQAHQCSSAARGIAAAERTAGQVPRRSRPGLCPRRGYHLGILTAPPEAQAAPAPHPQTVRRAAAAGVRPRDRLLRPAPDAGRARARSAAPAAVALPTTLHSSRTGSRLLAALPALHALRPAAGRLRRSPAPKGHGQAQMVRACPALTLRITLLSYAQLQAIAGRHCRPRITHVIRIAGPDRSAAAAGQWLRAAAGRRQHRPAAERPAAAARCCSSTGRAAVRGPRHSGPPLLHVAAAARAGQGRGRPPARAPAPRPLPPSGGSSCAAGLRPAAQQQPDKRQHPHRMTRPVGVLRIIRCKPRDNNAFAGGNGKG